MRDTSKAYIKMCDIPEIQNQRDDFEEGFKNDNSMYSGKVSEGGHLVWLPRQDQIQDMMGMVEVDSGVWVIKLVSYMQNHQKFYRSGRVKKSYSTASMEQLWLAFYMHEKHKKVWNGKEWV